MPRLPRPIRRRRRHRPPKRHALLQTVVITAGVTVMMTGFLALTVSNFDADEVKELSALVAALGPTVFGVLRYMKEG